MSICDADIFADAQWAAPQHMGFDAGNPESGRRIAETIQQAYAAGEAGLAGGPPGREDPNGPKTYAADTFEDLFRYAGLTGKAYENALQSVRRYNELCVLGRDEDFGKDSKLLRPLTKPPFVLQQSRFERVALVMVTVGGLLVNENQAVLDNDFEPIPGLYATGNCTGRRFGPQYSTPIAGSSIAIAHCLGREAGIAAATGLVE